MCISVMFVIDQGRIQEFGKGGGGTVRGAAPGRVREGGHPSHPARGYGGVL